MAAVLESITPTHTRKFRQNLNMVAQQVQCPVCFAPADSCCVDYYGQARLPHPQRIYSAVEPRDGERS
jgi:hypothetical protein